jgi:hypothetical protein
MYHKQYILNHIPEFDKKKDLRSKVKHVMRTIKMKVDTLPESVDLTNLNTVPIFNQWNLGSCVFNALSFGIANKRYKQYCDVLIKNPKTKLKFEKVIPSRLYMYTNMKLMNNINLKDDPGSTFTAAFQSVDKYKYCDESVWPYISLNFFKSIPRRIYDIAKKMKKPPVKKTLLTNTRLNSIDQLKYPLAKGKMIIFCFGVYESFYNISSGNPNLPVPNKDSERLLGYHAVIICGYDNQNKRFKIANSWGNDWGHFGFFYIDYDLIKDDSFIGEFYSIDQA